MRTPMRTMTPPSVRCFHIPLGSWIDLTLAIVPCDAHGTNGDTWIMDYVCVVAMKYAAL